MSKAIQKGIQILNRYFSTFPQPEALRAFGKSFLLEYVSTNPYTNSKKTIRKLYTPQTQPSGCFNEEFSPETLKYQQKPNRISVSGSCEGWLVDDKMHEELLQDPIFGCSNKSRDGNHWAYVAKIKQQKTKSYFSEGQGNVEYVHDFGQSHPGKTHNAIFVYDMKTRKTVKIPNQKNLVVSSPSFVNADNSKVIYYAFNREYFGQGFVHCFNRATTIYIATLENQEYKVQKLPSEARVNMFPSISKCGNYLVYFSGNGRTHCFYMDIVVLKKSEEKWEPYHILKEFFIGSYLEAKAFHYQIDGKPFLLLQTCQKASNVIYSLQVGTKQLTNYSQNKSGENYGVISLDPLTNLLAVKYSTPSTITFGYSYLPSPINVVDSPSAGEVEVETSQDPIPHFVLRSKGSQGKQPLVVLIHGGPHGSADATLTCFKYLYLQSGYTVLVPNYSGSTGYGKKHLENALGRIGDTQGKEIVQCIQKLVAAGKVDPDRVYSYGGSYGGYMGGILSSRFAEHFTGAVLLNPVLSLPFMIATSDIPQWCIVEGLNKSDTVNYLTEQDYNQLFKCSPIAHPPTIPVLVLIGGKDRRVPHQAAKLYVSMAQANGVDAKLYHYSQSDHKLGDSVETEVDVVLKSFRFIEESLRPKNQE